MKNLLFILFSSFTILGFGKTPIPEGRVESINYPSVDDWNDLYTTSEWKKFYKMKKISFITPEGVLEEKMIVVDSFSSEIPLSGREAMELSMSPEVKVVTIHYSTKELSPSWKKNLSFQKKILRREGSKVVFEEEKGQTEMTFLEFMKEKDGLLFAMGAFTVFSLVIFGLSYFFCLKTKKSVKTLLITALITWGVFSFLFSFWTEAFNFEIVIVTFILVFSGIFFVYILFLIQKIIKQTKRNKIKKQNKLKHVDTSPK